MNPIIKGILKKALPQVSRSLQETPLEPGEARTAILLTNNQSGELVFQIVALKVIEQPDRRYLAIARTVADGSPEELISQKPMGL